LVALKLPVFIGGSLAEHKLFIGTVCRFEHVSVPLCLFHYLTWTVVHVAMYVIAERLFGPVGRAAWPMRYLGYQPEQHRLLNESSNEWHCMAAQDASKNERKRAWHVRVIEAQTDAVGPRGAWR
jgi:hypothetical protein